MKVCASITMPMMVGGWLISNIPFVTGFVDESIRVHGETTNNDISDGVLDKSSKGSTFVSTSPFKNDVPHDSPSRARDASFDDSSIVPLRNVLHHTSNLRGSDDLSDRHRHLKVHSSGSGEVTSTTPTTTTTTTPGTSGSFEKLNEETNFSPGETVANILSRGKALRLDVTAGNLVDPDDEDGVLERDMVHTSFEHSKSHYSDDDWMITNFDDDCIDERLDKYEMVWMDHPIRMEDTQFYANATDDPKIGKGTWVLIPSNGPSSTKYSFVSLAGILAITIVLIGWDQQGWLMTSFPW